MLLCCSLVSLHSTAFSYASSVDVIHPTVTPSQAPMPSRTSTSDVVNSSTDKTLALVKFLHTGILANIHFGMVVVNWIRCWNNLSFQCKVYAKILGLLIKINPDPDFDQDNPTNLVSSFILAALPSFQLHMHILMFLIMFATFSLHAIGRVIHYASHCNPSILIQSIAYQGSRSVLWHEFLTTYFYIYFHTLGTYQ